MRTHFQSCNPSTQEILKTFEVFTDEELEREVTLATDAQRTWREISIEARTDVVRKIAKHLEDNAEKYAQLMESEMGKLFDEGVAEIKKCASLCEYSASSAPKALAEVSSILPEGSVAIRHEALGVILAVMPWNFPFWQFFRAAVPTLLCGNTVLLKHAMNTPQCSLSIQKIFESVLPKIPIVRSLFIDHEQLGRLIADKRVKGVTLTGSKRAGSAVATAAANAVKPCVLELGGSDPFIVFADADIDEAARVAANSRCINNGQSCIAAKRFIVEQTIFDRFTDLMTAEMMKKKIGPQATKVQQETLRDQVEDAAKKGAKIHCGGAITTQKGYFYPPTVLSHVTSSMRVAHEEVFGPVAVLYPFVNEEEAIAIANDSDFGLGATLFTKDKARAKRFAEELECGQVFVNDMVRSDPRFPFGGIKESGYGRELGPRAALAFTNEKIVWTKG